jgi:hypothetical protein
MKRSDFAKRAARAFAAVVILAVAGFDARAETPPVTIKSGDVLTGQLNAMRIRAAKGKRVNMFQLVSEPHRLPPPDGLCGLTTGPETFQIITSSDAQVNALKKFVGKQLSIVVDAITCASEAGQMSEAMVTKWSMMQKHNDSAF